MNIVKLNDAPDGQIQIWGYMPPRPETLGDLWAKLVSYGISVLEGGFSHMAIRMDNVVWSAEPEGFIPMPATGELRYPGTISVFTWEPQLTEREHDMARQCLCDMEGAWYDWPLFGQRLAKHILKFVSYFVSSPAIDLVTAILPIDVMASRAVVCYESWGRVHNSVGRSRVNTTTCGPKELVSNSDYVCLGQLEKAA